MSDDTLTGPDATPLRRTALYDRHAALGAKLADFGGWLMPIEYAGGGVLKEHDAVRTTVGLFDVSHLGTLDVRGSAADGTTAREVVNACLSNDLGRIQAGQAQYTLCCDDATGGVVDDLIVYLRADDDLLLVPNAANAAAVAARLADAAPQGVSVVDRHEQVAVLAVQGPLSDVVLRAVGLPTGQGYMSFEDVDLAGTTVTVCRTGYTGARGYELLVPSDAAVALWDDLLAQVRELGGLPAGLGARDTLRTEMGYPLHGHELSLSITPNQARAGWAVGWSKPAFWGREVLLAERAAGPARRSWGLLALDRGVPRGDLPVRSADGAELGVTTSGTFSPTLKQGIALALLDAAVAEGDEVVVDVRGRGLRCQVVKPPFVPSRVHDEPR